MINEENGNSYEPEDIPSTETRSKLETTKLPEVSPELRYKPRTPIATVKLQTERPLKRSSNP
jgi:hypothetical protein